MSLIFSKLKHKQEVFLKMGLNKKTRHIGGFFNGIS